MKIRFNGAIPAALFALALAAPGFGQYYSNDITPAGSTSGKLYGAKNGKQVGAGSNGHAVYMSGNAVTYTDLNPAGYANSTALSSDGVEQCGIAYLGTWHAGKWSGSASSFVDLNPSGYNFSYCMSTDGGQQAGYAEQVSYTVVGSHAMLWNGSSLATDLHPAMPYLFSRAMGNRGAEQVGYVSGAAYPVGDWNGYHSLSHAIRWAGTAASAVDMHPAGFDASEALATNGVQQGGWAYSATDLASHVHAMLWSGTAASAVDLHPAGYVDSKITSITDTIQVGEAWVGTPFTVGAVRHAMMWTGTAANAVDLNQYLPAGYSNAVATGVDANGNVVGYAYNTFAYGLSMSNDTIAVVFAPGAPPASAPTSITLSSTNPAPGSTVTATVTLASAAPAGGVNLSFLSTNLAVATVPASVVVPEGATTTTATISILGSTLTAPTFAKIFVSDGTTSRSVPFSVTPVATLVSVNVNPVEGGFQTSGSVALNIPSQAGGTTVALTSSNPAVLSVPATVTLPQFYTTVGFVGTSTPVTAATPVTVTATYNGTTVSATSSVNAAPVVSLSSLSANSVVGGQNIFGAANLSNFVRAAAGATVNLTSNNPAVQLPASILIPTGGWSGTFTATTSVVTALTTVTLTASYNGTTTSATVTLDPVPLVTVTLADYKTSVGKLSITATTSYANSTLTWGTNGQALGVMQLELGIYQASVLTTTPPTSITVWNSNGGSATVPVTINGGSAPSGGGGGNTGGGGGNTGGGGGSTTSFKLTATKNGKGTITCGTGTACAATYPSGTSVTLTATPDAGQPWIGWTGACTGTSKTCTLTITKDTSVTANFK